VHWLTAVDRLRAAHEAGVLVTLASVRGHAPRDAGAKMVVSAGGTWGSIGGGNLEATAIDRARQMLEEGATAPEQLEIALSDKARTEHGRQCCGGEVGILLEPLGVAPCVALFGMGHVGHELARILSRHDLDLHLVDSREEQLGAATGPWLADAVARVAVHHAPLPEMVLDELPPGTHVFVMTHDHAEDYALCDAALRCPHLATIGLIGSSAKWSRFERRLTADGHLPGVVARIQSPIGVPDLGGKEPATIAVAVAADLLRVLSRDRMPVDLTP
jgi:xanthine dehydrogenase accessory factor